MKLGLGKISKINKLAGCLLGASEYDSGISSGSEREICYSL